MLEMMRQNSRLIELMDRRLSAEEKRREEEEAARKAANVPLVGPVGDPFGSSGMSSSSAAPSLSAVGLLEVLERRNIFHRFLSLTIARWVKAEWLKWKSGCVLLTFSVPGWP